MVHLGVPWSAWDVAPQKAEGGGRGMYGGGEGKRTSDEHGQTTHKQRLARRPHVTGVFSCTCGGCESEDIGGRSGGRQ